MCGKAYEPDLIVAWPTAEISVMGAEGAVNIIMRRAIEEADDPDAKRAELVENFRKIIDPYVAAGEAMVGDIIDPRETRAVGGRAVAAGNAMIDDIIDPRETRAVVARALEMAASKHVERPRKKHGVMPV